MATAVAANVPDGGAEVPSHSWRAPGDTLEAARGADQVHAPASRVQETGRPHPLAPTRSAVDSRGVPIRPIRSDSCRG